MSFSLTIEVKTTQKYSVPGSGIFFVVIIFGCIGNSSLVIRNENIFVLILSIFFDFCPYTISGGNEQVSHQDEVLFYLSVELSTHSLCLHGNKQNHLLELWRNLELMQQTPSWFIYPHINIHIVLVSRNRNLKECSAHQRAFWIVSPLVIGKQKYKQQKNTRYETLCSLGSPAPHDFGSLPKRRHVLNNGRNVFFGQWFCIRIIRYTTPQSWNNYRIHSIPTFWQT